MTTFTFRTEVTHETATLHLVGDIDIVAMERLQEAGRELLNDYGARSLVVDCGGISFCDSTGLGTFLAWREDADARGKNLRLQAIPERLRKLVHLTGMEELLGIE